MAKRCGNCGSTHIALQLIRKPVPWRDYPAVVMLKPPKVLTCSDCGELILMAGETRLIDQAVEETLKMQVKQFIDVVLSREKVSQVELAERIGMTSEYLSVIKAQKKIPSYQIFNLLKILALVPSAFRVAHYDYVKSSYQSMREAEVCIRYYDSVPTNVWNSPKSFDSKVARLKASQKSADMDEAYLSAIDVKGQGYFVQESRKPTA
jgi:DNA-binding Xre family transcriptional regulator